MSMFSRSTGAHTPPVNEIPVKTPTTYADPRKPGEIHIQNKEENLTKSDFPASQLSNVPYHGSGKVPRSPSRKYPRLPSRSTSVRSSRRESDEELPRQFVPEKHNM